jgi:hypothetical protein
MTDESAGEERYYVQTTDAPWTQPPGWRTGPDQAKRGFSRSDREAPNVRQAGNFHHGKVTRCVPAK